MEGGATCSKTGEATGAATAFDDPPKMDDQLQISSVKLNLQNTNLLSTQVLSLVPNVEIPERVSLLHDIAASIHCSLSLTRLQYTE